MQWSLRKTAAAVTGLAMTAIASHASAQDSAASLYTEANMAGCADAFTQARNINGDYVRANGIVCRHTREDDNEAWDFALKPSELEDGGITIYKEPVNSILGSQRAAMSFDAGGKHYELSLEADGRVTRTTRDLKSEEVTDLPAGARNIVGATKTVAGKIFDPAV